MTLEIWYLGWVGMFYIQKGDSSHGNVYHWFIQIKNTK